HALDDATSSWSFPIGPTGSCAAAVCGASVAGAHTVSAPLAGATGTTSLQVTAGSLDHIAISPASATIAVGSSQSYTAQGFDSFNNSLGSVTSATTFSISPEGTCSGSTCTPNAGGPHTV